MTKFDIRKHITKRDKIAFLSSIIFFFLIHMFKIVNYLPNHDSLGNFYSSQNIIGSGRWFLTVACLPSSYFDLPWLIGVLCALYIALTSVLVVKIFDIRSISTITITSALLAGFPAITETMLFGFTADGYFLAMLLATVSVRLVTSVNQKWYIYVCAGVLLCLSCGIYQAYFSFAAILALIYLALEIIKKNQSSKQLFIWSGKQIVLFGISLVVYYLLWKLMMSVQGASPNDYQGISDTQNITFNFASLISSGVKTIVSIATFVLGKNFYKGEITIQSVLGAALLIVTLLIICRVIITKKVQQNKGLLILFLAVLVIIPVAAYFWLFASPNTAYGTRMIQSLTLLYLFPLVLAEKHLTKSWKQLISTILCLIIGLFALQANTAYLFIHQCYESTYHTTTEILQRAHITSETGKEKIAIVGNFVYDTEISNNPLSKELGSLTGTLKSTLAYKHSNIAGLTKNTFFNEFEFATEEELSVVEKSPLIQDMPCWPAKDSVKLVDGYIVIKLANPETEQN